MKTVLAIIPLLIGGCFKSFDTVSASICYDGACATVTGKVHHPSK